MLKPITNTKPTENEFFIQNESVYFSSIYENYLLKGVNSKDFYCWNYWGKSSDACFLGGIRLRGADSMSFKVLNFSYAIDKSNVYTTSGRIKDVDLSTFQVLDNGKNEIGAPQGYAKDKQQVYFHNGDGKVKMVKGANVQAFTSFGDTFFAKDDKRIYSYGKQLPKADIDTWEIIGHWYSHDNKRVYYLNREIKGADIKSFTLSTPPDAPLFAHHLAFDKYHYYQNDEIIDKEMWLNLLNEEL